MKSKLFHLSFLIVISLSLFFLISYLRAIDIRWSFIAAASFGIGIYYFVRWKYKKYLAPLLILLVPHLLMLIVFFLPVIDRRLYIVLPGLVAPFLSVFIAHFLWNKPHRSKGLVYTGYLVFCVWIIFSFFEKINHWENYGTFDGKIETVGIQQSYLIRADGSTFEFSQDGKFYLLDFWHSKCGVCFMQFPDFQQVYKKSLENEEFDAYAVNLLGRNEKPNEMIELLNARDFSFPTLFFTDTRQDLYAHFGVRAFPTYIIVQNNSIVFLGSLTNAEAWLRRNGVDL